MVFKIPDRKNIDTLIADQLACADMIQKDMDNQCLRRIYCRTNMTLVEGAKSG